MVVYEYPFNEGIRTMLRLEHLFDRLGQLIARETVVDHHFALVTMFEIIEVASRADLKSDLLRELDRQRTQMLAFRDNPSVAHERLDAVMDKLDGVWTRLNTLQGKAGAELSTNEWLMSIRSRVMIPGGTCEFDLPAYFAWQQHDGGRRRADLLKWIASLTPFAEALSLLLGLLREAGVSNKVQTNAGQYQQSLPAGKTFQLLRVRIDGSRGLVPEISGHRLMASIRLMQVDDQHRLRPALVDQPLELMLCS